MIAAQELASLSRDVKIRVLARLCHDVTVIGRDTYGTTGGVRTPERLRNLNEIQHRATGFLAALIEGDDSDCPNDAIALLFFGEQSDEYLRRLLGFAFDRVFRACTKGGEIGRDDGICRHR